MTRSEEENSNKAMPSANNRRSLDPAGRFQALLQNNRSSGHGGAFSVCSAHPYVMKAAVQHCVEDGSVLHVESTSSQVNQFGGYTGQTPREFAHWIRSTAHSAGLPADRVLLGGDHLGPFPWRNESSKSALEKARELVRQCVLNGYQKIHLDPSMPCDDDGPTLSEETVADRAAILCQAAEKAYSELPSGSPQILYVVGTEVPAPGGEAVDTSVPQITHSEDVHRTLEIFQSAFNKRSLSAAWQKVVALVVKPGVEFGSDMVFNYDRASASSLSQALNDHPGIVYEAHSTDYQSPISLAQLVQDHFAILKVGPWLTFAFREAVYALAGIERELFKAKSGALHSQVREALEEAMLRNPIHWRSYYQGDEPEVRRQLSFSYSDRCRYYWNEPSVQEELTRLFKNLNAQSIPLPLVSQYLPSEYAAVLDRRLQASPKTMIHHHIRRVLGIYSLACI